MPKKAPLNDKFKSTTLVSPTADSFRARLWSRDSSSADKEAAQICDTGGKPKYGRMIARWKQAVYHPYVEWPPDDGAIRRRHFNYTFLCMTCGHSGRSAGWFGPSCPHGHGEMKNMGCKIRLPRKKKLLKWLKKRTK